MLHSMTKLLERGPAEDAAQFFDVMRAIDRLERDHMHLEETVILPAAQSACTHWFGLMCTDAVRFDQWAFGSVG